MPESMPGEVPSAGASSLILSFTQIGRGELTLAGGKGANLGEMTRAGFPVPPGFCVTTSPTLHPTGYATNGSPSFSVASA